MIIKETKTKFIAICDNENEGGTTFKVGTTMGTMKKDNGGFQGATACLIELNKAFTAYQDKLYESKNALLDKVVAQLRNDLNSGDLTALYELLEFIPKENLEAYLPEWEG